MLFFSKMGNQAGEQNDHLFERRLEFPCYDTGGCWTKNLPDDIGLLQISCSGITGNSEEND